LIEGIEICERITGKPFLERHGGRAAVYLLLKCLRCSLIIASPGLGRVSAHFGASKCNQGYTYELAK
jgi:hypothetical protein